MTWERVMGASQSPVRYDKTSVLILGWDRDADDTKTAEEVSHVNNNSSAIFVATGKLIVISSSH